MAATLPRNPRGAREPRKAHELGRRPEHESRALREQVGFGKHAPHGRDRQTAGVTARRDVERAVTHIGAPGGVETQPLAPHENGRRVGFMEHAVVAPYYELEKPVEPEARKPASGKLPPLRGDDGEPHAPSTQRTQGLLDPREGPHHLVVEGMVVFPVGLEHLPAKISVVGEILKLNLKWNSNFSHKDRVG